MASRAGQAGAQLPGGGTLPGGCAMIPRCGRGVALLALGCSLAPGACGSEAQRPAKDSRSSAPAAAATVLLTPRELAVAGVQTGSATVATGPETLVTTRRTGVHPAR